MRVPLASSAFLLALGSAPLPAQGARYIDVGPVWAGHPVNFDLLTTGSSQFVAFYDAGRQLTVGQRRLDEAEWRFRQLDRRTGWDSHNYVTMALDRQGVLHLCGDMHGHPMAYWRSRRPGDAESLERIPHMVGPEREKRVTYPVFLSGPDGALVFRYRDGSSGNGDDLYNVYDEDRGLWRRLIEGPLVSGQGERNAYCSVPIRGPDGWYHMVWVWRDTPDAATNHDLSYARSRDLVRWETGAGAPLELPMTLTRCDIVDPVPVRGGMINGNTKLGFDHAKRPVITYHKYDEAGDTQVYAARLEAGKWRIRRISDWTGYRWDFGGGGTLRFEVGISRVRPQGPGRLAMTYRNGRGAGIWILDDETLAPLEERPGERLATVPGLPPGLRRVESDWPDMIRHVRPGRSSGAAPGRRYVLVWETLPSNRDRPRGDPLPPPSILRVVELR